MPGLHLKKLIVTTFELLETFGTQKLISDRIHTLKEKIIELQIGFHSFLLNLRLLMILVGLKAKLSVTQKPLWKPFHLLQIYYKTLFLYQLRKSQILT